MQKNQKLIDKLRKILAKANDKSIGQEEANAFMTKANQLLLNHNLTMSQVNADEETNIICKDSIYGFGKLYIEGNFWERTLLAVICSHNLCESMVLPQKKTMDIIGEQHNVESVIYMYDLAHEIFRRLSRQRYNEHKKEILDANDTRLYKRVELAKMLEKDKKLIYRTTFIQAYLKGATMGLHSKLEADRMKAEAEDRVDIQNRESNGEDVTGIIPLNKQLSQLKESVLKDINKFRAEKYGDWKSCASMRIDREDKVVQKGFQDGKNTNIVKGVESDVKRETVKKLK